MKSFSAHSFGIKKEKKEEKKIDISTVSRRNEFFSLTCRQKILSRRATSKADEIALPRGPVGLVSQSNSTPRREHLRFVFIVLRLEVEERETRSLLD
jgi:hypothetical protein